MKVKQFLPSLVRISHRPVSTVTNGEADQATIAFSCEQKRTTGQWGQSGQAWPSQATRKEGGSYKGRAIDETLHVIQEVGICNYGQWEGPQQFQDTQRFHSSFSGFIGHSRFGDFVMHSGVNTATKKLNNSPYLIACSYIIATVKTMCSAVHVLTALVSAAHRSRQCMSPGSAHLGCCWCCYTYWWEAAKLTRPVPAVGPVLAHGMTASVPSHVVVARSASCCAVAQSTAGQRPPREAHRRQRDRCWPRHPSPLSLSSLSADPRNP